MRRLLLALVALALLLGRLVWMALRRFVVQDSSMQPALEPGDRIVVARALWTRRGDVVVVRDPEQRSLFLVKRIAMKAPNGDLVLHADNPNVSRDSRHFGPVPRRLMVGRVIYRYMPGERRGRVTSRQ